MKKLISLIENWQRKCKCASCIEFRERHMKLIQKCDTHEKIDIIIKNIQAATTY